MCVVVVIVIDVMCGGVESLRESGNWLGVEKGRRREVG